MQNAITTIADRVRDEVRRYSERALGGSVPLLADEGQAAREIVATLTGFGPLQPYFDDAGVEEVWINGPDAVFIARDGVPSSPASTSPTARCATWSSGCCSPRAAASTSAARSSTRPCRTVLGSTS